MRKRMSAWIGLAIVASPAAAAPLGNDDDRAAVIRSVEGALNAFSVGDMPRFRAAWADRDVIIVDDVAPYIWTGPDSLDHWLQDTSRDVRSLGLTKMKLVAGRAERVTIVQNRAYLVLPIVVSYEKGGVGYEQHGIQTLVLDRKGGDWITRSMSYAGREAVRVEPAR